MHKSSEHSDKDCVWNEDAPTVISCAHFKDKRSLWSSSPQALFVFRRPMPGRKGMQMKIRVLYEENIKNGHKFYTTIDIPDDDYSIMLDIDYEQRLAEAKPEKKAEVKRCETVQEMLDLMNSKEYNNWRRFHRHLGDPKTPYRKDDESEDETDVMDTIADYSQEIERNHQDEYESVCQWIRTTLGKKQDWADMFIAVRIDGMSIREYASSIGVSENNITQKLKRATQKLRKEIENRQI